MISYVKCSLIQIIREYRANGERINAFLEHYSVSGTWAVLFQKDQTYHGTKLMRDIEDETRYLTIDSWDNTDPFTQFRKRFAKEYQALHRKCEKLTDSERCIGVLELVE